VNILKIDRTISEDKGIINYWYNEYVKISLGGDILVGKGIKPEFIFYFS